MSRGNQHMRPHHRQQVQQIAAHLSEGVILIDVDQSITWANAAALAMHGVDRLEALGRTIDEYHAIFQVKFRKSRSAGPQHTIEKVASGEGVRDVVIEITPAGKYHPEWVHRVRNMVLTDGAGNPTGVALVLHAVSGEIPVSGQFASSLEATPYAAAIVRLSDQICIDVNDLFVTLTGFDRSRLVARSLAEVGCLSICADSGGANRFGISTPATRPVRSQLPLADGTFRSILLANQPIDVDDQRCILFTFIDTAPSWNASEGVAPQNGEGQVTILDAICASVPVPVYVVDADLRVLNMNEPWLTWLGYTKDVVLGRKINDFMTMSSAAHFHSHGWPTLHDTGVLHDVECHFVRKSGEPVVARVSGRVMLDEDGGLLQAVCTAIETIDSKQSEDSFNKAFAMAPIPMIVRKVGDTRILAANAAFFAATGYSEQAVIGHSADELGLFETRAQRQHFEQEMRAHGRPRNLDARFRTAAGDVLDCLLSGEQIHVFGQPCVLLAFQDVTDRRRNELQLFQAIENVMNDTTWFTRSVIEKLAALRSPAGLGGHIAETGDLTKREREVLAMISQGHSDLEIAQKFGLTRSTVRNHVATLYSKIGVHSRSSAIVWARERGINIKWPLASIGHEGRLAPL
jgi:PAS domain S-box-containing protein